MPPPRVTDAESLEHHVVVLLGDETLWETSVLYTAPVEALNEVRSFAQDLTNTCNAAIALGAREDVVRDIVRRKAAEREERLSRISRTVRSGG